MLTAAFKARVQQAIGVETLGAVAIPEGHPENRGSHATARHDVRRQPSSAMTISTGRAATARTSLLARNLDLCASGAEAASARCR
jgi:hypothetical protein